MRFQHYQFSGKRGDVAIVNISGQANVKLMDGLSFNSYRRCASHRFYGGGYGAGRVVLPIPHPGHWHIAVDLGGRSGIVNASIEIVNADALARCY